MKKKHIFLPITVVVAFIAIIFNSKEVETEEEKTITELRELHQKNLDNSPFKAFRNLSREERKAMALPPNGYNEQMWELTMDPQIGRPVPQRTFEVQQELRRERANNGDQTRGVGGDGINPWVSRGPTEILGTPGTGSNLNGGRTRGIMFDPNDTTDYNRVFAGGVSGGLWVNEDITDANSSWTLVSGLAANIAVNVIIHDPNNTNTFYIGAGESYTNHHAIGNGIWKSTDAGVTWTQIWGGYTGTDTPGGGGLDQLVDGIFYINDLVARDNGGSTELYAAVAGGYFRYTGTNPQWNGLQEQGVYRSTDNGANWNKLTINESNGSPANPSDIEIDIANNVWVSTTNSSWGFNGGRIFRSTNGTTFTEMVNLNTATGNAHGRTEIECSQNNANTLWVATSIGTSNEVNLYTTTDAFSTAPTAMNEPNDADAGIPSTDYTRNAAWYNLTIEADANDNLIVGGINLFRSTNNGSSWSQISKWSNNPSQNTLTISFVHADHHATVFRPGAGNENKIVFGTDGGVFYSDNILLASASSTAIQARNKNYNTIQFYYGDISNVINGAADDFVGGTQDNGTPAIYDGVAGANQFTDAYGGDGAYSEFDDAGNYILTSYTGNNHYITLPADFDLISSNTGGSFINQAELDKNLDILYSNSTAGTFYKIERNSNILTGNSANVSRFQLTNATNFNASPTAMKVSPYTTGSTKLFVGLANGRLLRVDNADGGSGSPTWTNITGTGFLGSISDIEFGPTELDIFVTFFNYGTVNIWYSSDGGLTWQNKEGNLPDIPVRCILQNPLIPNELIIGTDIGVWATSDYTQASPNWIQTNNGMSETPVVDLDLRASDNVILASTHGRGMFTSQFTSNPLSVTENTLANSSIRVYPTVSNGEINISANVNYGVSKVEVYTLTGQRMYDTDVDLSSSNTSLNLNLSSGMYLIKITNEALNVTKRIIIE